VYTPYAGRRSSVHYVGENRVEVAVFWPIPPPWPEYTPLHSVFLKERLIKLPLFGHFRPERDTTMTKQTTLRSRLSLGLGAGVLSIATLGFSGGCATNDAMGGAALGAGLGAIGGAVIGHNQGRRTAEGAAIGAGVGAVGGYIIGNERDKARMQQHYYGNYRY